MCQVRGLWAEDEVCADSAYVHHAKVLCARGYEPKLCEKGFQNKLLTDEQKAKQPGEVQDMVPGGAHLWNDEIAGQGWGHALHRDGESEISDWDA